MKRRIFQLLLLYFFSNILFPNMKVVVYVKPVFKDKNTVMADFTYLSDENALEDFEVYMTIS